VSRDGGVVNVHERHHTSWNRNVGAFQAFGVTRTIPSFVMCVDDVFGQREDGVVSHSCLLFSFEDDVTAVNWMAPHRSELPGSWCAWLVENAIGHADLADVMERREARQQIDPFRRQILVES